MATFKERFANALFGTPKVDYGAENQAYLDELAKKQDFQNLAQRNNLTLDEALAGVMQGRNYGDKNIAQRQQELGINIPQNQEEVALADRGLLNNYTTRQGGFLNDLASGYRENATQGFNVNNLAPVQNKGLATRIGEGLGTLARFYDKPIGRMAVATGLSMLTDEANPLGEGVKAYVGRQTNMTKDKAYRQNLQQMGYTQEEIDSIPGIFTDDIYKNLVAAKQAEIMANYRNDMLKATQENRNLMNQYRLDQLEETKAQHAYERMLAGQKLSLEEQRLALEWAKLNQKDGGQGVSDSEVVMNQLDELMKLHSQLPQHNAPRGTKKVVSAITGKASDLGLRADEVAAYEGVQNMMTNLVARKLAGEKGVMTDKDFDRAKKMLPNIYDTPQQAKAKYDALKLLYYANPKNVATSNTISNNTTTQIGNYKEGQTATNPTTGAKIIFRGGKWQTL